MIRDIEILQKFIDSNNFCRKYQNSSLKGMNIIIYNIKNYIYLCYLLITYIDLLKNCFPNYHIFDLHILLKLSFDFLS